MKERAVSRQADQLRVDERSNSGKEPLSSQPEPHRLIVTGERPTKSPQAAQARPSQDTSIPTSSHSKPTPLNERIEDPNISRPRPVFQRPRASPKAHHQSPYLPLKISHLPIGHRVTANPINRGPEYDRMIREHRESAAAARKASNAETQAMFEMVDRYLLDTRQIRPLASGVKLWGQITGANQRE